MQHGILLWNANMVAPAEGAASLDSSVSFATEARLRADLAADNDYG